MFVLLFLDNNSKFQIFWTENKEVIKDGFGETVKKSQNLLLVWLLCKITIHQHYYVLYFDDKTIVNSLLPHYFE